MDTRKKVIEKAKAPSTYEQIRESNIGRNEAFLDSLGILTLDSESQNKQKEKANKKRKPKPTDEPEQPARKSSRHAIDKVLPVHVDGILRPVRPVTLQCKFCLILSVPGTKATAEAWIVKHLEENVTCISIRSSEIAFEVDSLVHAKDKRFDMSQVSQLTMFSLPCTSTGIPKDQEKNQILARIQNLNASCV